MDKSQSKSLKAELKRLRNELELAKELQKKYNKLINETKDKIKEIEILLNPPEIEFTDHGLVRYVSRICKINLKIYEIKFIEKYKDTIYSQGGTCTILHDNLKVVIRDFKIITVIDVKNES